MNRLRAFGLGLLAVLALGACATSGAGGDAGDRIAIEVDNSVAPPTTLTISIEKDNGIRHRLGTITSNSTGRFRYNLPGYGGYRLIAEPRTGRSYSSNFFTVNDVSERIIWDIGGNSVVVR